MEKDCNCLVCAINANLDKREQGLELEEIINSMCSLLDVFRFDEKEMHLISQAAILKVGIVTSKEVSGEIDPRKEMAYILSLRVLGQILDDKDRASGIKSDELKPSGRVH